MVLDPGQGRGDDGAWDVFSEEGERSEGREVRPERRGTARAG